MDKRLGLAVVISMGVLFAWWKLFPPAQQQPTPPAETPAAHDASAPTPGVPAPTPDKVTQPAGPRPAEQEVALDGPQARFVLSTWGARLKQLKLKDRQFLINKNDPESGLQIVTSTPAVAPLRTSFAKADFALPEDAAWTVEQKTTDAVVFRAETDAVVVQKRFAIEPNRFRLNLTVTVQNKTDKPQSHGLVMHVNAHQDPEKTGGGFFSGASADAAEVVCYVNDKAHRVTVEAVAKDGMDLTGGVRWVAAGSKFFTVAALPSPENPPKDRRCTAHSIDALDAEVMLTFASRTIGPGEKTEYPFEVFAGPKFTADLEAVRVGGENPRLADVVDVTFAVLSRPMLALLKQFYKLSGNWGIAIILLTIFVKLITFYPTQKTLMSAKKMQRLAPKIAALRQKYGDDRQRLGVETMNLYKAHGVSPFGGCLPSLIQMPIWIALFSTLNYAVELHRAGFLIYITDLSAKDPYYITPLLMGAVMYLQMRMSPAGTDPQQQKMMAIMMPIMFTGFSLFLPAGLSVYTLTSYLLGIVQQLYANRLDRRAHATA
jgi:YidC/Oxa1 family membrane protein insertase